MTVGRNFSILAVTVAAMAFGLAGVGLTAEPASHHLQMARLNNGSQGAGAAKRAPKKK